MKQLDMNKLYKDVIEENKVHDNILQEVKEVIQHARKQDLSNEDYDLLVSSTLVLLAHDIALESATRMVTKVLEHYGKDVLPEIGEASME